MKFLGIDGRKIGVFPFFVFEGWEFGFVELFEGGDAGLVYGEVRFSVEALFEFFKVIGVPFFDVGGHIVPATNSSTWSFTQSYPFSSRKSARDLSPDFMILPL